MDPPSSNNLQSVIEGCDSEPTGEVTMLNRYINHLFDSIKRDSDEIYMLCQQTSDVSHAKRLRRLYQSYARDLTSLVQYLNMNEGSSAKDSSSKEKPECMDDRSSDANRYFSTSQRKSAEVLKENHESQNDSCKTAPRYAQNNESFSAVGHNVDAPCFIPLRSNHCDEDSASNHLHLDFDPGAHTQWMEMLSDGFHHFNQNLWHLPALLHSQYPMPHYHMVCPSNVVPYAGDSSMSNFSSVLFPGLQSHGLSFPLQYPHFPHYPSFIASPHHSASDSDNSDHLEAGKRPQPCLRIRSKAFSLQSERSKLLPTVVPSEMKTDAKHDIQGFSSFKKDSSNKQDIRVAENKSDIRVPANTNSLESSIVIKANKLSPEDMCYENTEIETTQNIPQEPTKLICIVNPERPSTDVSTSIEDGFSIQERLRDFPELIPHGVGSSKTKIARKMKYRLPRVKYQKKPKFSLADLYKTFGPPNMDRSTSARTNKNLLPPSTSNTADRDQKSKANMYLKPKCCCSNQLNVYPRCRNVYEKGQEEVSDEADGWKKVKPRFRNKDPMRHIGMKGDFTGLNTCKVCHSNYPRFSEPSNQKKKQQFRNDRCGIHSNNCVRSQMPSQVLDLHYKNMFVPTQVMQKQRKLNNTTVMRPGTSSFRVARNDSGVVLSKSTYSIGKVNQLTQLNDSFPSPPRAENFIASVAKDSQEVDFRIGQSFLEKNPFCLSPFIDEDVSSTNTVSILPNAVSLSCLLLETDEEENRTPKTIGDEAVEDTSVDEDSQPTDKIPVVQDAQNMHEDFMKYLNSSTWPTQMDEIDKFESMVAGNNPSDPVLMYPSVSVEQFEEFIHRHPDEAQAFRREICSKLEKIKETESKQQQAYEKRLQLLECKTAKVRGFVQKVKDVQLAQDKLALKRKHQIDEKLRKAEENRKNYLSIIRRKAHDEEEKLKEIAFINELEAQNRRHDSLALRQEHEERLQCIIDERQRKVEEKAAKEAAVEERRRVLEAERQQKLLKIAEARRKKEETIDRKQQERENKRLVIAREKAREREERLLALNAAQRATAEELQKRIQQKQEDSARRHEENIESIRQRALDIGLHRNPDDTDELVSMDCDVSTNGSKEKLKALKKKRCRKLRSRMTLRASEFMKNYSEVSADCLCFGNILDAMKPEAGRVHINELLLHVTSLKDILAKGDAKAGTKTVFEDFSRSRGFVVLVNVLKDYINKPHHALDAQHLKLFTSVIDIFQTSLLCGGNWKYFILSNDIMFIMDCLRFSVMGLKLREPSWSKISELLIEVLTHALDHMSEMQESKDEGFSSLNARMADVVSYIINSGLVEKIIIMFQDAVMDDDYHNMNMIPSCIKFFTSLINKRYKCDELMNTLVSTDCFGTIPLLYEGLQKMAGQDQLPVYVVPVIDLLLKFADLDVVLFQNTLGDDGMALQVRAIASNLMNYCKGKPLDELLQSVILLVGYFAIKNVKNQTLLQSGQQPTVLQQLVTLPFIYFCDVAHTDYLFPTLYVCSFSNPTNKAIVANELSFCHLEDYIKSERGKNNKMIQLFYSMKENDRS